MPGDRGRAGAQGRDQVGDVLGQHLGSVVAHPGWLVGGVVAGQVGRDHPVAGVGEGWDLVAPGVPELGEAVQQHHQWAGAHLNAVKTQPADVDPPVGHAPGASHWVIPSLLSRATRDSNEEPSAVNCSRPALPAPIADHASRNIHILLLLVIAFRTLATGLLSPQTIFRGEQCTKGAFARANKGEGSGGVVADIAKLSVGREEYYTRELATDHEQYLSGHGESPGRWYGAGAASLGLQGEVSPAGFKAMFEGRHPDTGELLGRPHGKGAVPAFDVVLRPTKSVSILYGLGDAATGRAVLAAHHAGLAEAVGYLDEHLGARRGHGGVQHVSGQGLLAVGFDHRTSREGDPLVHTHLVIANRVQGPDGRWTALDGRDVYRHRLAADAIYRATYQRELARTLGVEWTPADSHGNRELAGMPEELVRGFSKRTGQIDAELDRLVADGRERTARLVKWAVQATRKPKQHEIPDTLYGRWRTEAAERGVDADSLLRAVTGRTGDRDQTVSAEAADRLFDRLAGPDGLTEHASTFTRPDVLVALGAGLAGAGRTELEALADRFLAERAVSLVADRTLEERRWSTPDLLAVEQRLVAGATDRTGEQTAVASHQAVGEALAAHPTAGADQQAMIRDLCQGGQGVALVVGRAGTGKTFALGIARHAWQLDGYRLLAAAPTGIATVSLQGEGFEDVATCDRLLGDLDRGQEQLTPQTVLVVDEAGMLGSRKLARLLEHAEQAQAKVILVADDRQLAAIDAGGGFRALRLRLGASELTENRRQQQAREREALELVRSGLIE